MIIDGIAKKALEKQLDPKALFPANFQGTAGVGQSFDSGFWICLSKIEVPGSKSIKEMKCENLQFNLPLYADDVLTEAESAQVSRHLETCPLCRAKLAEYQSLRNDLLVSSQIQMPDDLLYSVRNAVASELNKINRKSEPIFSSQFREWLQFRLMPYSVGTVASLVLTFSLLITLLSTKEATQKGVENAQLQSNRATILTVSNSVPRFDDADSLNYSELNLPIADESPSINPAGALMALTKSIVRGKMKDEDVTVVADVFGNGIAKIAEVVEAPRDSRAMEDLQHALNETPNNAPFVTAKQDNRSNVVRVVLKIQRVDVIEKPVKTKTKGRSL